MHNTFLEFFIYLFIYYFRFLACLNLPKKAKHLSYLSHLNLEQTLLSAEIFFKLHVLV